MGYNLEYPTEDSWNEYQLEIEEEEDEWESWSEIPIMMYGEELDTKWIGDSGVDSWIYDESNCKELDGEDDILWEELDPHIIKLLGNESFYYQTTWIEEADCFLKNRVMEHARCGQGVQESDCMTIDKSGAGMMVSNITSSEVKTRDQNKIMRVGKHWWAPSSSHGVYFVENWRQHEWSERDKNEKNGSSMEYEGEKKGIG